MIIWQVFSANVQDVLAKFDFDNIIRRMVESNTLYLVIKEFNTQKGYLGPDKISAVDCGYIFEDLVRRFSESFGEEAGAHFTSRDIIYLMTDLLLADAKLDETGNVTVYDMTMGTSQMLFLYGRENPRVERRYRSYLFRAGI